MLLSAFSARANHWNPDIHQFENNMNVIGVIEINGMEQTNASLELGAFCNDECRGSERLTYYPQINRYYIFLTLYGSNGNPFSFRLFDHETQTELDLSSDLTLFFSSNAIIGTVFDPQVFAFAGGDAVITVNAMPAEGGLVTGGGTYAVGTSCQVSAVPAEHYRFIGWTENGTMVSAMADYAFGVTVDRTLTALFEQIVYEVGVTVTPEAAGTVTGAGPYVEGQECTLMVHPSYGYTFTGWMENDVVIGIGEMLTFIVDEPHDIEARFAPNEYEVTLLHTPEDGGITIGDGTYPFGSLVALKAIPNATFYFINWTEGGEVVSVEQEYVFEIRNDRTLTATFAQDCHVVTATAEPSEGGSVRGAGNYVAGTLCSLKAVPAAGYAFENWTEGDEWVSADPDISFVVYGDRDLTAHFTRLSYEVKVEAVPAVGGVVEGGGLFYYGENCHVSASPAMEYDFLYWQIDGNIVSEDMEYEFPVTGDCTIVAVFDNIDGLGESALLCKVFPNPSQGEFWVAMPGLIRLTVYDISGRVIMDRQCVSDAVEVSVDGSGLYVVEAGAKTGCVRYRVVVR